jgi:hypothetical protein
MLVLSGHAQRRIAERATPLAPVEAMVNAPDRVAPDALDPAATHLFRAIPEAVGKVLKVVHKPSGDDVTVVTAHLDRGARR